MKNFLSRFWGKSSPKDDHLLNSVLQHDTTSVKALLEESGGDVNS